jgi:hypothetical protein
VLLLFVVWVMKYVSSKRLGSQVVRKYFIVIFVIAELQTYKHVNVE